MNLRKVRILRSPYGADNNLPKHAYGGKVFNQVAPNALPDKTGKPPVKVKDTLKPVAREGANIEAEKGETAFFLDVDGLPAHYKIAGNRHTKGGTPLNVPEDTFIFSDTKSMTIKDIKLLNQFGETKPKTPAKIAEKYDMNTYRKILADRDTDQLQKQTAEKMIENYTMLLGKLALLQESMKGFPQGIPMIAQPYMVMNGINPEDVLPEPDQKLQQQVQQGNPEEMMEGPASNPAEEMSEAVSPEMMAPQGMPQMPPPGMGQEMMPPMEGAPGMEMGMAYGGYANPFAYNPLQKYIYGNGGAAQKRRVRIVSLPTYGDGGPKKNMDVYDYVQEWVQKYIEAANAKKFQKWIPPTITDPNLRTRYTAQSPRRKGSDYLIYGDPEVESNWEEFKQRHAWYFKDTLNRPDMTIEEFTKADPKNKKSAPAVKAFQKAYNAKATEYGLPEYFNESGKGIQGTNVDGQYGEHTYSAPSFNKYEEPPVEEKPEEPVAETNDITPAELNVQAPPDPAYGFFPQDLINMGIAAATPIPNIKTAYTPVKSRIPDFASIRENYSPLIAAQRVGTEGAAAYAQKPAGFAMASALAGKTADAAARHNEEVAKYNAGAYGNWSAAAAAIDNENAKYNSLLQQADFDARQLYAKDRLLARGKKMGTFGTMLNNAITNATDIYNMNAMTENFAIDPTTGGLVTFVNPRALKPDKDAMINRQLAEFQMWRENTDLSDDQILQLMRAKDAGLYDNANTVQNPYEGMATMQAMLNRQGYQGNEEE